MNMTLRWYGTGFDTVTLKQIRQIPGVTGVITTLYDSVPGEAWETEKILSLKKEVEDAGLLIHGIESVNVSDAIKVGTSDRDRHIENYITSLHLLHLLHSYIHPHRSFCPAHLRFQNSFRSSSTVDPSALRKVLLVCLRQYKQNLKPCVCKPLP